MFQDWNVAVKDCVQNGAATLSCLPAVFANLLSALWAFTGLTALIMFIIGGFRFIYSEGDPKRVSAAENNFKFGIIGGLIALFAFFFIQIISVVTGVTCITKFGFGCN